MWRFWRWDFTRWWILLLVLGSLLRLWNLGAANRWYDEIFTAWAAVLPWGRMIAATAGDVHPPAHYALVWAVAHLFGSDATWLLRLPSALASIAAMPMLLAVARRLKFSDAAILAGTAFMAFSPFQLYYAQEIRMYALFQLEILIAVWAMLAERWWLLVLTWASMLWTHNYGFVYCAVIGGIGLLRSSHKWMMIATGLVSLWLYTPWGPVFKSQFGTMDKWWQQPTTPGAFLEPFQQFVWGNPPGWLQPISQIVIFSLLALAVYKLFSVGEHWTAAALACGPMLVSVGTEVAGLHPTYLHRTFIGSSGFVYLLIGLALTERSGTAERITATAVLAPLFALTVILYYPITLTSKGVTDTFLPAISERMRPGDLIYHMNPGSVMSFREAHPDRPAMFEYVHPSMPGDIGTLSSATLEAFGVKQVTLEQLEWDRAWLVFSAGPTLGIAEDQEVLAMVHRYHGVPVVDAKLWYSDVYRGQVWLLKK